MDKTSFKMSIMRRLFLILTLQTRTFNKRCKIYLANAIPFLKGERKFLSEHYCLKRSRVFVYALCVKWVFFLLSYAKLQSTRWHYVFDLLL